MILHLPPQRNSRDPEPIGSVLHPPAVALQHLVNQPPLERGQRIVLGEEFVEVCGAVAVTRQMALVQLTFGRSYGAMEDRLPAFRAVRDELRRRLEAVFGGDSRA